MVTKKELIKRVREASNLNGDSLAVYADIMEKKPTDSFFKKTNYTPNKWIEFKSILSSFTEPWEYTQLMEK